MSTDMGVVIDFVFLRGRQFEIVVKELSVATKNVADSFRFKSPNSMTSHKLKENGHNWVDGHVSYNDLYMIVSEAVDGFAHIYVFSPKCWVARFLTCRISKVLSPSLLITNVGTAWLVTNFPTSIAAPKPRIQSTIC